MAAAITNDSATDLHKRYLEAFWAEEFDVPDDPISSTQKRDTPPRKKIRAYLMRVLGDGINPSKHLDAAETISKAYSGFVHAASPQIMDMCEGDPPKFRLSGMRRTIRINECADDAWYYFYRSLMSVMVVAKAFGDKPLVDELYKYRAKFEATSGVDFERKHRVAT